MFTNLHQSTGDAPTQSKATAWQRLEKALAETELPDGNGGTIRCEIGDFMFMGFDGQGNSLFKNSGTRNYLSFTVSGELVYGTGGDYWEARFMNMASFEKLAAQAAA